MIPGSLERSAAGCSDRDSWCWLLGILTVLTYLWKEQLQQPRYRFGCAALSGFFMLLGGLSWEGFGIFGLVILAVELWRFLTTETEEYFTEYLLWVFLFVPWLYLLSPAYRQGEGFSTHLSVLVLLPPLVLLALRCLRHLLTTHTSISRHIRERLSGRSVALVLTAGCLLASAGYALSQYTSFALTTVPFSNTPLMKTVEELGPPQDVYWQFRYGGVFLLGILAVSGGCIRMWGKQGAVLTLALCSFTLSTFFREYIYYLLSPLVCEYLFYIGIAFIPIAALGVAVSRKYPVKNEFTYVAIAAWFLLWVGLARGAKRYDFFIGFPLAFFAAMCLHFTAAFFSEQLEKYTNRQSEAQIESSHSELSQTSPPAKKRRSQHNFFKLSETPQEKPLFMPHVLKTCITVVILGLLLFWQPPASPELGFLIKRGIFTVKRLRTAVPGRDTRQGIAMENALHWMKTEFPEKANVVVAGGWSYGSLLNVLGGVKTVIDQDHFIQHWIHLYSRHVFCAQSEPEALVFLKTHEVTHLMLMESEVLQPHVTASVGSNEHQDRAFKMQKLNTRTAIGSPSKYRMVPSEEAMSVKFIDIDFTHPSTATALLKTGKHVTLPYITTFQKTHVESQSSDENGGILHYFDQDARKDTLYYIPSIGWNNLAIRLFFRNIKTPHFIPVHPLKKFASAKVKVWEIHYPSDIKAHPKYLATDPED